LVEKKGKLVEGKGGWWEGERMDVVVWALLVI